MEFQGIPRFESPWLGFLPVRWPLGDLSLEYFYVCLVFFAFFVAFGLEVVRQSVAGWQGGRVERVAVK